MASSSAPSVIATFCLDLWFLICVIFYIIFFGLENVKWYFLYRVSTSRGKADSIWLAFVPQFLLCWLINSLKNVCYRQPSVIIIKTWRLIIVRVRRNDFFNRKNGYSKKQRLLYNTQTFAYSFPNNLPNESRSLLLPRHPACNDTWSCWALVLITKIVNRDILHTAVPELEHIQYLQIGKKNELIL